MTLRIVWVGLLIALVCCATAIAAPSADVETCLRDGGGRYADPGAAVDDQYSDAAGACHRLLDGGDIQVTISGGNGTGGGASSGNSSSGGSSSAGSSSAGSSSGAGTPAAGGSSGGTSAEGGGQGSGAAATDAEDAGGAAASRAHVVKAALVGADAGNSVARPSALSGAPAWLLLLGGVLVVGICAGVTARAFRTR